MKTNSLPVSLGVNKVNHILLMAVILSVIVSILPLVQANLGTYKQSDCVNIRTILNSSFVNISSLSYPNLSLANSNIPMTKVGLSFNYTFCNTDVLGVYLYDYFDDSNNVYVNSFEITGNGKTNASGSVIVLFSLIFIIVAGLICFLAITSLGHLLSLDYDILDFAKSFGIYVVIFVLYFLEQFYVGNPTMDGFLLMIVSWGWIFFIMIPSVALILSLTVGTLQKKKMNVRLPQQARRRI
jgi:hypothetical protein